MLGGLGDLMSLMKNAKPMMEKMKSLQEEAARKIYEAEAGAGAVSVRINGKCEVLSIKIQPDAAKDLETLEEFTRSAINAAIKKQQEGMQQEMSQAMGGLNLGGLAGMLGGGGG